MNAGERCKKKMNDGSQCPNPGRWQPVLLLYPPHIYGFNEPFKVALSLTVCDGHQRGAVLDDFVPEAWPTIIAGFEAHRRVPPEKSRTQLAWMDIRDVKAMQRAKDRGERITAL